MSSRAASARLDHLVVVVPDLGDAMSWLGSTLGCRPVAGGRHTGLGTCNALIGLGEGRYLEAIAPDRTEPLPIGAIRPFGADGAIGARLVTWAARVRAIDDVAMAMKNSGVDLGPPINRSRRRPDGSMLTWCMTPSERDRLDGVIPFLIEWHTDHEPGVTLPAAASLRYFRLTHPAPHRVRKVLSMLGIEDEIEVVDGPAALDAEIIGTAGRIHISSSVPDRPKIDWS
ncbi:MAG: VOC family protein [Streptosporangiaceae bacterium]